MIIEKVIAPPYATNAYLVGCEKSRKAIVIDPGFQTKDKLLHLIEKHHLIVEGIYLTHSHFDHIADVALLKREKGWPVYVHKDDAGNVEHPGSDGIPFNLTIDGVKPDGYLEDNGERMVGEMKFVVLHTPGHSPGCVCFYFPEELVLFSGDTLFKGTYGRTDLPRSDEIKMKSSLERLKKLPDELLVYPGHASLTKLGREKTWL